MQHWMTGCTTLMGLLMPHIEHETHAFHILTHFCFFFIDLKCYVHVFKAIEIYHALYLMKFHQEWVDAAINDWMYFSLMLSKAAFRFFGLFSMFQNGRFMFSGS